MDGDSCDVQNERSQVCVSPKIGPGEQLHIIAYLLMYLKVHQGFAVDVPLCPSVSKYLNVAGSVLIAIGST